ncbi:MAG: molecular chaperone [Candidatus Portnoybacteria bacterium CG_4_9_14_3_um_filter_43_11]|uniref:Molecular chaperone n=1 Tax=Candidatus Portnoybacteria bacterium CG_4_9_14_3_um_filter_43_11 TaxID=1974805 RepID=A0A2M7YKT9_9BACT|nr:MAG: molecular chaperone [Candidatus Portnoybacteria bacterium CG_4_9_14_3_um_filter_43_11]
MAKKSFFEKLTGASWTSEDSSEEKKIKTTKKIKKSKAPQKEFLKKETLDEKKEPEVKKEEEWLSESEGQLTIDVYQTPNEVVIKSTIAGVKPEDIDITMTNDMITIKGKRKKDEEVKEEDYYYQECYWGPFSRSVILPVDVEVDSAEASMKNSILTIKLPKIEKVKTKKIKIKSE